MNAVDIRVEQAYISGLIVKVHIEGRNIFHPVLHVLIHAVVTRHDDPHVIILSVNVAWQGSDHVRQTACLDERNSL